MPVALLLAAAAAAPVAAMAPLQHRAPVLTTPWTAGVSSTNPLPEYPRPQLQRSTWLNLNGRWEYEAASAGSPPPLPAGQELPETILVPFPVQSALSGIQRSDLAGYYRRTFTIPRRWAGQQVLLNFGAVSWGARVWVNGHVVGSHRGDYSAFSLDITRALHPRGANELIVWYVNPMGAWGEPVGKQTLAPPGGILHSGSSGIWQTVWLEPVSRSHIIAVQLTPDVPHHRLGVSATVTGGGNLRLSAQALDGRRAVASRQGGARSTLWVSIPRPHLWWPWDPHLYNLRLVLSRGRAVLDQATSYFGMRSVSLGRVAGATRILLNGRFVFQTGALDQGYWPDGLYAAPTDAAVRDDLAQAKGFGYDMLREHAKVQPDRWYLWADRMGLLVWQDMPNMSLTAPHAPTRAARAEFRRELTEVVTQRRSHPSIVTWIPFNEGWQQFDLAGVTRQVKREDPAALVDSQSGSANCCDALETSASDVRDTHLYTGPFAVPADRRATVVGEYGGILPFPPAADRWPGTLFSVGNVALSWPPQFITGVLRRQYQMLDVEMRTLGLSGSIFTEFSSPEQELGLLSYDRRVDTVDPSLLRALNARLIRASLRLPVNAKASPPPPVPAGSTGYWPLSEGNGLVGADASGHAHPLTFQPGAAWTRGRQGRPALLLGNGAVGATQAPVLDTASSFTVGAWLRADARGQTATAISQFGPKGSAFSLGLQTNTGVEGQEKAGQYASGVAPPALRTWWTFTTPDNPACSAASCPAQANMHYDDGRLSVVPGTWHYVVGVVDVATQTLSVYVDGEPQDVEHVDSVPPAAGPLIVGAGQAVYGQQDFFRGAIAQVRTYGRALSPGEIWQLYQAQRS